MLDMDGTIYNEDTLIPGASEFFDLLNEQGKDYVFMTNNSSKGKTSYVEKLNRLGIKATERNICSSRGHTLKTSAIRDVLDVLRVALIGGELSKEYSVEKFKKILWQARKQTVFAIVLDELGKKPLGMEKADLQSLIIRIEDRPLCGKMACIKDHRLHTHVLQGVGNLQTHIEWYRSRRTVLP